MQSGSCCSWLQAKEEEGRPSRPTASQPAMAVASQPLVKTGEEEEKKAHAERTEDRRPAMAGWLYGVRPESPESTLHVRGLEGKEKRIEFSRRITAS